MIKMLANNKHDSATLTASAEILSASNTQKGERSLIWRSPSSQAQTLTGAMSGAGNVDCVSIFRHNLGVSGTFRLELLYNSNVIYDSGTLETAQLIPAGVWRAGIDPWGATQNAKLPKEVDLLIHWLDTPILCDTYRLTLKASSYQQTMDIGRIFVGESFGISVNYSYDARLSWIEDIEHKVTEGGTLRSVGGGEARRKIELKFDWLNEADRQALLVNLVKAGKKQDLLISMHPKAGDIKELEHTLVCRRENDFSHTHTTATLWQSALNFIEV